MVNPAAEHYHALPQIGSYIANMLDHGIYYWRNTPRMDLQEQPLPQTHTDPYQFQNNPTLAN
jgi:hypothetical protein